MVYHRNSEGLRSQFQQTSQKDLEKTVLKTRSDSITLLKEALMSVSITCD